MKLLDPLQLKNQLPRFTLIFSYIQDIGKRPQQEDAVAIDTYHECFAVADGVSGMPHGGVAATLASEAVIWNYELAKHKKYYFRDKRQFVGRLFRSANWVVYNKRREEGFETGMATTLLIIFFSEKKVYVANAGDARAFRYRKGKGEWVTSQDRDDQGLITKALGIQKDGPVPSYFVDEVTPGDTFFLGTDGVVDWVSKEEIISALFDMERTEQGLKKAGEELLHLSTSYGSGDNKTVCIIHCVTPPEQKVTYL